MPRETQEFNPEKKEAAIDIENIEQVEKQVNALRDLLDETGWGGMGIGPRWSPEARAKLEQALAEGEEILADLKKEEDKE